MKKITYVCGNDSIEFTDNINAAWFMDFNDFNPHYISGVFDERTSYGIDGSQIYSQVLSKRQIKWTASLLAYNVGSKLYPVDFVERDMTALMNKMFSPRASGRLFYYDGRKSWQIDCVSNSIPVPGKWNGLTRDFTFDLIAPDPYWQSTDEIAAYIGDSSVMFTLPSKLPSELGVITSRTQTVYNPCAYNVFPVITIYPCGTAPVICNESTGKRISLNTPISDGYYVEIDTNPKKMTVNLFDGLGLTDNVSYWLTLSSDVDFYFAPGENTLNVKNIVAGNYKTAKMSFREVML